MMAKHNNSSTDASTYEAIEKLLALKEKGAITEDEYNTEKQKILQNSGGTTKKEKQKKGSSKQLRTSLLFLFLLGIYFSIVSEATSYGALFWIFMPLLVIRGVKNKKFDHKFTERFRYPKIYLGRILLSIVVLIIGLISGGGIIANNKEVTKVVIEKANTPTPVIKVLNDIPETIDGNIYELELEILHATSVKIAGKITEKIGENKYLSSISLDTPTKNVTIQASNKHHTASKKVVLKREATPEEQETIEKAEAEKKAKEEAQQAQARQDTIDMLNEKIVEAKTLDTSTAGGEPFGLTVMVGIFDGYVQIINDARKSNDPEISRLANTLERELIALQKREFPKMRKQYGEYSDKTMRENNTDVYTKGAYHDTIELIRFGFADRGNIATVHNDIEPMLKQLRFTTVNYRPYEGGDGSKADLETPNDGELIGILK